MNSYRLSASQHVPRPLDEVFAFFAEPRNLARITPRSMSFEFLSDDFDMRAGLTLDYRLRPLPGFNSHWRTLISEYSAPRGFVDVQLEGPYRHWRHHHRFSAADGGTLVEDEVEYQLPLGPLGTLGHELLVRNELERIFRHRARTIERIFEQPAPNATPLSVAVAGGTGFVGGAIARELFRRGERVRVVSHRGEAARNSLPDAIELREADATQADGRLEAALEGVDELVVALAFDNSPIEAPRRGQTFQNIDARGTERLVDAARAAGVRHVVYMSGAGAEANAKRHWFRAKWQAEEAVRASGLAWTIVRPTWIYGPDDVSLNRFIGFAQRLQFVPLSNLGRQRMAPVFIDDVARLVADSLREPGARRRVFEIGGPETMSMREVVRRALAVADMRRPVIPGPAPLIKLASVPLALLPEPPLTPDAIDFVNQPATVDVGPLLELMPRRLTPFEEGLATYLAPEAGPGDLRFGRITRDEARVDAADRAHA